MATGPDPDPYCDIVLLGKTGQGKSTLAKKLLDNLETDNTKIRRFSSLNLSAESAELLSNEDTKVRVLDVPGLSDPDTQQKATVQRNQEIIQWIGRVLTDDFELKVKRIVYFLPTRGPLEKADGTMQEELKILNHYFGKEVFDCVVVAATNSPKEKYQQVGFDDDDLEKTKRAFHITLKTAIDDEDIACPPVVYIGLNDSPKEALSKIQEALVLKENIVPLRIKDDVGPLYSEMYHHHPSFVQKYSGTEKFRGGIIHVFTFGILLMLWYFRNYNNFRNYNTLPGFTNSDKICKECKQSPKARGCVRYN